MHTKTILTLIALIALTACGNAPKIDPKIEQLGSARDRLELTERRLASKIESLVQLEAELAEVQIVYSRLIFTSVEFDKVNRRIDITIQNTNDIPISAVSFKAILESPGRTFPWASANLVKTFQGGLEVGEEVRFEVSPGIKWQTSVVMGRDDLVVTLQLGEIFITELDEALTEQTPSEGISGSVASDISSDKDDIEALKSERDYLMGKIQSLENSITGI